MSKRTFTICMGILAAVMLSMIIVTACTAQQAEKEIAATDAFIAQIESTTVPETTELPTTEVINDADNSTIDIDRNESGRVSSPDPAGSVYQSVEELAAEVLEGKYGNGPDRAKALGERYDEVQAYIDANHQPPTYVYEDTTYVYQPDTGYYYSDSALTPDAGINYYGGVLETYYNMDMSGVVDWMHSLGYEGDYWVRSDGVKMFGNYVMVAADYDYEPKGTITETSLGLGIVCDTGLGGWGWHDIAVDW